MQLSVTLGAKFRAVAMLLAFALFGTSALFAQASLGSISGVVRDPLGAVVPGAKITLINEGTGATVTADSASEGGFVFSQLVPGFYTIKIEAASFRTNSYKSVKVDAARTFSINVVLETGIASETVEVLATTDLVNTSSADVSNTVAAREMSQLPLNGRNPIELIRLQAGVTPSARTATVINGGRPSWTNITQDGVSINDNYIRTNAVDFVPNRPSSDQIAEFTVVTSGQGVDSQFGASQVKLTTPAGTNDYHGTVYEFNRNSALGANAWTNKNFADKDDYVERPFLNRNQFGFNLNGPILKKKLFGYGYYEGLRQASSPQSGSGFGVAIPRNADLLQGIYRYTVAGQVRTVNVLNPGAGNNCAGAGTTTVACSVFPVDPAVQSQLFSKFYDSALVNVPGSNPNVGRYLFNQSRATTRDQWGLRFDYDMTSSQHIEYIMTRSKEVTDRPDIDGVSQTPKAPQDGIGRLYIAAWRWTLSPRLQNEVRVGVNDTEANFLNTEDYGGVIYANLPLGLNYPLGGQISSVTGGNVNDYAGGNPLLPQGRRTVTFQYGDNVSYVFGNHNLKSGFSLQQVRVRPYNERGALPVLRFGFSSAAPAGSQIASSYFTGQGCTTANGCSAGTEAANANALRAFLAGIISQTDQRFQVLSQSSGFVPGIANIRHFEQDNLNIYVNDSWRLRSNLTLTLGLKWEYYAPLRERDDLALAPVVNGNDLRQALLDPNASVDFIRGDYHNKDLNNFGPTVGFAWDPFKDGKTSIRAGYGLAYVTDDNLRFAQNVLDPTNAGLQSDGTNINLFTTVSAGPALPATTFKVPRTLADQLALGVTQTVGGIDPNLRNPMVHNINFGIQRELPWDTAIEVRYVGSIGRELNRTINLNQINALGNAAFAADFNRARNNFFNCNGNLNPTTASCAAAQPLQLLNTANFGSLANTTVITAVRDRAIADLANFYVASGANATVRANARSLFLANPGIYEAFYAYNGATSDYHSMQAEVRRRFAQGLSVQANYTFSKLLTDSIATGQTRIDTYLDNNRPEIDRGRSEYDIRHAINSNFLYELPIGRGKTFLSGLNGALDRAVSGWQTSGIIRWQSGSPVSIISGRGTFNRATRATEMAANSTLSVNTIQGLFGIYRQNGFAYAINPTVLNQAAGSFFNTAVGGESLAGGNATSFGTQVFFNPDAGQIGALPLKAFNTPSLYTFDFSVLKRTRITERINSDFQISFFNVFNSSTYFLGRNQNINSSSFMQLTDNVGPRVIQLGLRVNF